MTLSPTFDPSPSCTLYIYRVDVQDIACVDGNGNEVICGYFHLGPTTSTSDCLPTSWTPTPGAYISPGACPRGYTVACAQSQIGEPENTGTCCPSGYSCQTNSIAWPWQSTDRCFQPMADTRTYVYTTRTPGKDFETSSITGGGELNAFGVVIRWQASDLITSTSTTTSTSISASTPAPTAPSLPTSTPSAIETSASSDPGSLSVGAEAGIGVGAAAAFVMILAGAFSLWRTRRKKDRQKAGLGEFLPRGNYTPAVAISEPSNGTESMSFGRQTDRSELSGRREPAELWAGSGWK